MKIDVPEFMIERAISQLESFKSQIDAEIMTLKHDLIARDWKRRRAVLRADFIRGITTGKFDDHAAATSLIQNGQTPRAAAETVDHIKRAIDRKKKAARDVEIFRRWNVCGEKKTSLARELGLSRATIERICRRLSGNADALNDFFYMARPAKKTAVSKKRGPEINPAPLIV